MSRLVALLKTPVLSNTGATRVVLETLNYAVIPVVVMLLALHQAWATATTPFERFVGTAIAIALPLLWPVFVRSLSPRHGAA